jgi:hypothetical protein
MAFFSQVAGMHSPVKKEEWWEQLRSGACSERSNPSSAVTEKLTSISYFKFAWASVTHHQVVILILT